MSADGIAWAREHAAKWSARAAELRGLGDPLNLNRAIGLEGIVAGLNADIDAARATIRPDAGTTMVASIERHLVASAPRVDPASGVTVNGGAIMTAVREDLHVRLAARHGEPRPIIAVVSEVPVLPPAEPLPFTAGPQLDLFDMAA